MPENFGSFLTWLGSGAAFAIFTALFLEKLPFWATLNSDVKAAVSMLAAVGLGFLSKALVQWVPAGVVTDLEPWYQVVIGAIVIWEGSQAAHTVLHIWPVKRAARLQIRSVAKANGGQTLNLTMPPVTPVSEVLPNG